MSKTTNSLSVIICTYNPVITIINQCLLAIKKASTLSKPQEIILIDNNSNNHFTEDNKFQLLVVELGIKLINEPKQGLTPARLRGIKEAKEDLLVFIDDDNFIEPNFFEKGLTISTSYPFIGAWSGQVKLVFEQEPQPWTKPYWGMLVWREFTENKWSNFPHLPDTMPCGAGLFVRKQVATHYYHLHESGKRNIQLDRSGKSLFSGGDNDLAACACDIGMGVGIFHEFVVNHYIPNNRLTEAYLLKLAEGIAASTVVFKSFRGELPLPVNAKNKFANFLRAQLKKGVAKKMYQAVLNGEKLGVEIINKEL